MSHAYEPVDRCCPTHPDWTILHEHLIAAFPSLQPRRVLAEVRQAREATERFGLNPAASRDTVETITRHQLASLTAVMTETAGSNL
jgi:hypothetical protein